MNAFKLMLGVIFCGASAAGAAETVDFGRDIQPILAEHCYHCHGQDNAARKAGLRLDQREAALLGGKSKKPAIVPGKAQGSELLARITTDDSDDIMPPLKEKKPLKPAEIEKIRQWITAGAPYAAHWAFTAPVKTPLDAGAKSPVDAFVQARLKAEKLTPSPAAPPHTLGRRIYLDVIGLPPTPAELDAFVKAANENGSQNAAAALTSKLLASKHYGEKWARPWLDAARYSDSNGYEKDLPREQWAWRNWVIDALNRDLTYDQFIIEQIAGDMLPNRTQAQLIATGFLRNGMINEEGAIIPEQFRMDGMFDRIDAIGKSVLGLSVQCAQCHSHKFDPITQDEYYGMFAFLNNAYEAQSWVYSSAQEKQIGDIHAGINRIEAQIKQQIPDWREKLDRWEAQQRKTQESAAWEVLDPTDLHSSTGLNHPVKLPDKSVLTTGHRTIRGDVYIMAQPTMKGATGIRVEALTHGDLPYGGPGRSFKGTWALTELIVETKTAGSDKWEKVPLQNATADFSEESHAMEPEWENKSSDKENKRTCGPVAYLIDGKDDTAWRADRGPGRRNSESVAVAQFVKPFELPAGATMRVSLRMNHGGDDNGPKNVMLGRVRLALTTTPNPKAAAVPYPAILALQTAPENRTPEQQQAIFTAWAATIADLKPLSDQMDALWKTYPEAQTSILHLAERAPADARRTHRLDRGGWDRPKEEIAPHVPAALNPLATGAKLDRLTYARWLADKRSPLTARVAVNRVWQAIFGRGLVETAEDFGTRAPTPEYRELLDWLAVDFMEHNWSQKHLIQTILASQTYQQSAAATPQLLERDPRNALLARGPRFRVDAEVVRDIVLATSGLLTDQVGGASFFPPVPQSVLDVNYFKPTYWKAAEGSERYRRSLYIFRKSSMPDPVMGAFDAPNGDLACARRPRSNTPLAALAALNEPVFVEAAQAMSQRILREGGTTDAARADHAFKLCTGRTPTTAERDEILNLLKSVRPRLAEGWLAIRDISVGEAAKMPPLPAGATPQDAAAWTIAARVLLNLDETLCKN